MSSRRRRALFAPAGRPPPGPLLRYSAIADTFDQLLEQMRSADVEHVDVVIGDQVVELGVTLQQLELLEQARKSEHLRRVKEGMRAAEKNGRRPGRPRRRVELELAHLVAEKTSTRKAAAAFGVSSSTLRARLQQPVGPPATSSRPAETPIQVPQKPRRRRATRARAKKGSFR